MQGGFSMQSVRDAEQLYAGARSFWKGLPHVNEGGEEGLGQADENIAEKNQEGMERTVIMYSGCRDDQTSADANIAGAATGVSPPLRTKSLIR
jgi:hypothetical protein